MGTVVLGYLDHICTEQETRPITTAILKLFAALGHGLNGITQVRCMDSTGRKSPNNGVGSATERGHRNVADSTASIHRHQRSMELRIATSRQGQDQE